MNNANTEKIKKYALLVSFFIATGLILWGSSYITAGLKRSAYLEEAEYIIKKSPLCENFRDMEFIKSVNPGHFNMTFCNAVFEVKINGKKGYLSFVNMSGKYGIYQGMFLSWEEQNIMESSFCGLAGQISDRPHSYYGITSFTVKIWQKKLDTAFQKALLHGLIDKES